MTKKEKKKGRKNMLKFNEQGLLEFEHSCKECKSTRLPTTDEPCPFCGMTGAEIKATYDRVKKFNEAYWQNEGNQEQDILRSINIPTEVGKNKTPSVLIVENGSFPEQYDPTFYPKVWGRKMGQLERRVIQMEQRLSRFEERQRVQHLVAEPVMVMTKEEAVKLMKKDLE